MPDIVTEAFLALCSRFFDEDGEPIPFSLRDKLNTQDDPFDEFLATDVLANIDGITCAKASGPLITPDMVPFRPEKCADAECSDLLDDIDSIVGIEVKKLERTAQGSVARKSGLDYNTTPPCGRVRVYDSAGSTVDIRGFYLFVCLEKVPGDSGEVKLTALCLIDGNALNEDFDFYLSITGEREKSIGLGTFGDGADRARPMLIFANPLGVSEFDGKPILIHPSEVNANDAPELSLAYRLSRTVSEESPRKFYCYQRGSDLPAGWTVSDLADPFLTPERDTRTRPRGKFRLPFRL